MFRQTVLQVTNILFNNQMMETQTQEYDQLKITSYAFWLTHV
jgi:hypothetical protein